jgi:predicted RNA-binding Zn-ribbon protein involved in translation (DUF1610 family)
VLTSKIKSRPQYGGLQPVAGAARHLIAAEGQGAGAVAALFAKAGPDFAAKADVLYLSAGPTADTEVERLRGLHPNLFQVFPTIGDLLADLGVSLRGATMGTRLYATGTEGFIGRVVQLAIDHGVDHRSVLTEHSGSLARRVQCVHCKGFTENVTVTVFPCSHCGLLLFVRDHYSRRLAAFQGVCVNAEDPASKPPAEEAYP